MNFRIAASILAIAVVNSSWTVAKEIRNEKEDVVDTRRHAQQESFLPLQLFSKNGNFVEDEQLQEAHPAKQEQVEHNNDDTDIGFLSFEEDDHQASQHEREDIHRRVSESVKSFDAATSCQGQNACDHRRTPSYFVVGQNACLGVYSCYNAGSDGKFVASDFSCLQERACEGAGAYGQAMVGQQSCMGRYACSTIGKYGNVDIQNWSCIGKNACYFAGRSSNDNVTIASDSCVGENACIFKEINEGAVSVGAGSCKCDGCCSFLKAGSVIGDGQCNSLSDNCSEQTQKVCKPESACSSSST